MLTARSTISSTTPVAAGAGAVWTLFQAIHDLQGNLTYADGSVQQATATVLGTSSANAFTAYGAGPGTSSMVFPQ